MPELNNDLTNVKPGDTLLISSSNGWQLDKVDRVTATQVVINHERYETRYRKDGGRRMGDSGTWSYANAYLYDAAGKARWRELQQEHTRKVLENRLQDTKWHAVDAATLAAVAKLLLAAGQGPDTLCEALSNFQRYNPPEAADAC
jgi:hypothetical protein